MDYIIVNLVTHTGAYKVVKACAVIAGCNCIPVVFIRFIFN